MASAGAAAVGLGVCVFAAPEIVVGAVIITGVVVGFAISVHPSYAPHSDFDAVISNEGTLDALYRTAEQELIR